jgi:hypothetical protein
MCAANLGAHVKNILSSVFVTGLLTLGAAPVSSTELAPIAAGDSGLHHVADYRHGPDAYRRDLRFPYFKSYGAYVMQPDPWWRGSGYCAFGSYVACYGSGRFCWQRCY